MQNNYISTGFSKWPNTSSWESVRIFLQGYLYAVTQHLLTRWNFLFFNFLKGFQRPFAEISQYWQLCNFIDNSNHLKDLIIRILWNWQRPSLTLRQWYSHTPSSEPTPFLLLNLMTNGIVHQPQDHPVCPDAPPVSSATGPCVISHARHYITSSTLELIMPLPSQSLKNLPTINIQAMSLKLKNTAMV